MDDCLTDPTARGNKGCATGQRVGEIWVVRRINSCPPMTLPRGIAIHPIITSRPPAGGRPTAVAAESMAQVPSAHGEVSVIPGLFVLHAAEAFILPFISLLRAIVFPIDARARVIEQRCESKLVGNADFRVEPRFHALGSVGVTFS